MSYHLVDNADTTSVELMPFSALEDDQEYQADDFARPQHSSLWNSFSGSSGSTINHFGSSDKLQHFRDECTRRWHLLSKPRQRKLQILFILTGVLLIVTILETTVKTIYHNHVKAPAPILEDWDYDSENTSEDDALWKEPKSNNLNGQGNDSMTTMMMQDCDIPVHRILCENLITPLFKLLDESLDFFCFQRNKMMCNGELVYERDGFFYTADWNGSELLANDFASLDSCQDQGPEIWSPLAPFHSSYDAICEGVLLGNKEATTNRFCQNDQTVDWIKVQQTLPKCLIASNPKHCTDDNLNWNDILSQHLNCWEFEIAFRYIEIQKHPGEDLSESRHHADEVCKRQHRR